MEASGHSHEQAVAAALRSAYDAGAGVLVTHGDRTLFLKRSAKARDHGGEWCCPGGSIEGVGLSREMDPTLRKQPKFHSESMRIDCASACYLLAASIEGSRQHAVHIPYGF